MPNSLTMPLLKFSLIYVILLVNNISYALEQSKLEQSLHQYYQLNIDINRYWMNDNSLKYKAKTEKSLELMHQAMSDLLEQQYTAEEYLIIKNNWVNVSNFIKKTALIEKGYTDIALIASYRVFLDKMRLAMLKRYHENPPTSDISNLLMLFDRVISTYVEINTDVFGSFIRSATDDDMNLIKLAKNINLSLDSIAKSESISKEDLKLINTKWNFIRHIVTDSNSQSLPFIVLLNGQKIIKTIEHYHEPR
jgi:hypothetical protein